MNADENQNILEKQLKTLGQKIRIEILKKLSSVQSPLSFSRLQKDVVENRLASVNLSFHLKALKKCDLILSTEEGYSITFLGEQIIEKILSIEQILNKQTKARMIRTSKYSKELFDINKIEDYLVNEGELDRFLARQIAHEVEERLSKTNIEYMTAPLMREYINAVLLENSLEEVRHKLTRLGTPPFEVMKLFNLKEKNITPEIFIKKLGSDVSEQFLLLNLLPKNLSDLYLTGEIALLHLNYWSLRPLSIYINTDSLIERIFHESPGLRNKIGGIRDATSLILNFMDALYHLKEFCSEDLIFGNFNNQLLSFLNLSGDKSYIFSLLANQILKFNRSYNDRQPHLTLDFNYCNDLGEDYASKFESDQEFLNLLPPEICNYKKLLYRIDYSKILNLNSRNNTLNPIFSNKDKSPIVYYNGDCSGLLNSSIIKILNPKENSLILDKILINLHMISIQANQNDDLFLDILHEKMNSVFEMFDFKETLVKKKINSLKEWDSLSSEFLGNNNGSIFEKAMKSVSFFGLNEAILNHCGIELDRTENSEVFSLRILSSMKELIDEKNEEGNYHYILSQPHNGVYLKNSWHSENTYSGQKTFSNASKIIREDSSLSINKKIMLFKKFEKILNGGTLFNCNLNNKECTLREMQEYLTKSNLNAFKLN